MLNFSSVSLIVVWSVSNSIQTMQTFLQLNLTHIITPDESSLFTMSSSSSDADDIIP